MRIATLTPETQKGILQELLKRSPNHYGQYEKAVAQIIQDVREKGDEALFSYTEQFDRCRLSKESIRVTPEEIEEACASCDAAFLTAMERSAANIRAFHEKQKRNGWFETRPDGTILGMRILPIASAGVYVPGGKAAYPSSVLMNVLPAKAAGVERIIMCTPPGADGKVNPGTLAAAKIAGVDEIYKAGGAQAIAAMAFGTESVPKVDKITGPGNIFVALAKKACFGHVSIDSVAGPSEILVIADESANPRYIAADLLSQAEHDIIQKSLDNYGYILLAKDLDEAAETANQIASEHLEILTKDPFSVMTKIKNAGAVFLGEYSSEPLGDYFAGPNHVLPTNGTARFFSPLNVDDFVKKTSLISYSREALFKAHEDIECFAEHEGLTAHANSVRVRFER